MQTLRKRAIRIWDMKGENHQTQVYKSLYFLILIMYPPHVVNYNIQNQTTNLYLQYWICWMVQQPLWNVPLLLLSYIITLFIHFLLFSFIIITCLTFVFSHGCSFLFLSQILLYSKFAVIVHEIIKIVISSKAKSFFSTYLFLSLSLPLSTKPLSCHLEASSHTTTMCLLLCSKKKIVRVEWSMYLKLTQFLQWCLPFQVEWWVAELIFLCLNN